MEMAEIGALTFGPSPLNSVPYDYAAAQAEKKRREAAYTHSQILAAGVGAGVGYLLTRSILIAVMAGFAVGFLNVAHAADKAGISYP